MLSQLEELKKVTLFFFVREFEFHSEHLLEILAR